MPNADLVLANARLVTPRGVIAGGAAIRDGRFIAIGEDDTLPKSNARIDARGCLVFPGLVDPHVHLGGAFPYEQNLVTECQSAAAGGVTTLLQYRRSPTTFAETFPGELETNQKKMALDTAFHFIISSLEQAEGIPEYASRWGVRSYKLYMGGYAPGNPIGLVPVDDGVFWRAMEHVRELGPYAHVMCHAENQGLYMLMNKRAHDSGRQDLSAYAMSHPDDLEIEAVQRLVWLGERTGCPVYIVHTTTGEAIATASAARRRGVKVTVETCPHYLALAIDDARLASQGPAIGKVSPPLRDASERDALWTAIDRRQVDLIGTDHVPILKTGATVWEERPGFAGLGTMLPVLITFGLLRGRISAERLAELCAAAPARIFGLAPRKGAIAVGADADAVIVDLDREAPVGPQMTHSRYTSAFEGLALRGWPVLTLRRGETVFVDGEVRLREGSGEILRPGAYDTAGVAA
ncbi:MAG TPA: amidohydrolase family protein [Candidatus Acidoferrales bacterium]|nr:amidohydrolase family protein [Candidatus Acidoferrales bacterium]